jgi:TRAP-type C4-dicarboxylate transport system permease large subunit
VGLNLYVMQAMRRRGSINKVIRAWLPFVIAMLALIALEKTAPDMALVAALFHG